VRAPRQQFRQADGASLQIVNHMKVADRLKVFRCDAMALEAAVEGARDDDVLPNSLLDSVTQAGEATAEAMKKVRSPWRIPSQDPLNIIRKPSASRRCPLLSIPETKYFPRLPHTHSYYQKRFTLLTIIHFYSPMRPRCQLLALGLSRAWVVVVGELNTLFQGTTPHMGNAFKRDTHTDVRLNERPQGSGRCTAELLIPELWDVSSGPVMAVRWLTLNTWTTNASQFRVGLYRVGFSLHTAQMQTQKLLYFSYAQK
jgi:hypothetical protein